MSQSIVYLTVDQVEAIHAEAMEGHEAEGGVRSSHLLASAVMQPQQSAAEEDAYPSVAEKAAAYRYFLAENQPFHNGNKRTALLTLTTFLDINGYELVADDDEIAQMFEDLGLKVLDQSEFFGWVVNHTRPKTLSNVVSLPPRSA
jgi:death on curing protein